RLEIPGFVRLLSRLRIQCLDDVPSLLKEAAHHVRSAGTGPLESIEILSVGGEAVPMDLVRDCRAWGCPNAVIMNGYSPSATTPIILTHRFDGTVAGEVSLLGKPRQNAKVLILGPCGDILPTGLAGDLHVGGLAVSRGYIHQPVLTAERFRPGIWGDGSTMY